MFAERKRNETERNGTETETAGLRRTQIVAKRNVTKRNGSERAIPIKTERKTFILDVNFVSWLSLYFQHFGTSFSLIWLLFCVGVFFLGFLFFFSFFFILSRGLSLAGSEIETEAVPLLFNAN